MAGDEDIVYMGNFRDRNGTVWHRYRQERTCAPGALERRIGRRLRAVSISSNGVTHYRTV